MQSLQRFIIARDKQQKHHKNSNRKKKRRREEDELIRRYRHILPPEDSLNLSSSSEDDEDNDAGGRGGGGGGDGRGGGGGGGGVVVNGQAVSAKTPLTSTTTGAHLGPNVALSASQTQTHRPFSDCRRISDTDNPLPPDRRSVSAREDIPAAQVTLDGVSESTPTPTLGALARHSALTPDTTAGTTLSLDATSLTSSAATVAKTGSVRPGSGGETPGGTDSIVSSNSRRAWSRALVKNRFASMSAEVKSRQVRQWLVVSTFVMFLIVLSMVEVFLFLFVCLFVCVCVCVCVCVKRHTKLC